MIVIDRIILTPNEDKTGLEITLQGDIAGILTIALNQGKPLDTQNSLIEGVKLVAEVGFEPTTFRL